MSSLNGRYADYRFTKQLTILNIVIDCFVYAQYYALTCKVTLRTLAFLVPACAVSSASVHG